MTFYGRRPPTKICLFLILLTAACAGAPSAPRDPNHLCGIFEQYPDWHMAADRSRRRWGVPIPVMMAILYHESGFRAEAKPPRTTCLWVFPGPRPSSAYGYPQAIDSTWDLYRRKTGNRWADRDDFADAVDFVGWYCHISHLENGIPKTNGHHLYLAYHEGWAGYRRGTFRRNRYVLDTARRVAVTAARYQRQISACPAPSLRRKRSCLWPF